MKRFPTKIFGLILIFLLFAAITACDSSDPAQDPQTDPSSNGDCDRQCLLGVLDSYLEALAANDPSLISVSQNLKYTDNGVEATLGKGLWETAESIDNRKRLDFADPQLGNVATQVVVNESGGQGGCGDSGSVIYQVRLNVQGSVITEIESMTVRRDDAANGFFNIENMAPEAVFSQAIPAGQRMSREELLEVIDLYMDYLDGDIRGRDVPFDQNCKRYENGVVTASGLASFNMQSWGFNTTRRYLVVDEDAGIVWGLFPFARTERCLVVGEAFKVIDGKIMMIQAVMARMPAKAWD